MKDAARRWMRCLVRLLLLPLAFVLELVLLTACSICIALAILHPRFLRWGDAVSDLALKTPDLRWYLPNADVVASPPEPK